MDPQPIDVTDEFAVEDADIGTSALDHETDPHRLAQRQKQIDFGKNTIGYQRYRQMVPKEKRRRDHPRTPDVNQKCSKRSFDGQIRKWRRKLHDWDIYPQESNPNTNEASTPSRTAEVSGGLGPKNVMSQRQGTGLPLTMTGLRHPAAERTKRANSATFMEALLSPTNVPPHKMLRKKGNELPSNVLMAKWRELEKENIPVNTTDISADMVGYLEEVSYSDHEMETIVV